MDTVWMVGDVNAFDESWRRNWGDKADPIGWHLRGGPAWVRFHSLPESKRYADTADEELEILRRHYALIIELNDGNPAGLVVISLRYPGDPEDDRSEAADAQFADALLWRDAREDERWGYIPAAHLSPHTLSAEELAPALKEISEDGLLRIVVTNGSADWLYIPYGGGADVFARTISERDRLRERHTDWLPRNAQGL